MKNWIWILGAVILQGCATTTTYDPSSRWYHPPVGSVVQLHEDLVIVPRHTRVYLQDGEVWGYSQVDMVYPFCNFEVRERKPTQAQTIKADHFTVTRVEEGSVLVVEREPVQLASAEMRNRFRHWIIWKDGPRGINRFRHHWLGSDSQHNVMRLTCYGGKSEESEAQLPTLEEIRQVLGNKVTIHLTP
ncbi:MAG: hypothetical protein RNU03_17985 [Candidatus Sedimenticola sp. (ex Thyasira tokunagai)]